MNDNKHDTIFIVLNTIAVVLIAVSVWMSFERVASTKELTGKMEAVLHVLESLNKDTGK